MRVAVAQPGFLDQWADFACVGKKNDGQNGQGSDWWAQQNTDNVKKNKKNEMRFF
jgi:hypothetical protein